MEGLVYHRLLAELRPILLGGRLDKIHQVSDLEICLVLRNAGKNHRLILSASPSHPGFHLAGAAPGRTTGTPSGFCLLARRHLIPGTISALTQSGWERVIHLHCVSRDELGRRREPRLILELMGKHSNLILVEGETETILGALKLVPAEKSSVRQVLPGRRYVLPPAGERLDTVSVTRETLLGTLRRIVIDSFQREWPSILPACFTGIGQLGAREICWRAGVDQRKKTAETTPEEMERLADQLLAVRDDVLNGRTAPVLIRAGAAPVLITSGTAASGQGLPQDAWIQPLGHLPPERQEPCPDLVQATAFLQEQLRSCDDTLHKLQQLRRLINQSFRRARRLESALSMELEEGKRAEFYRRCGELVLANLNLIVPRTDKAALT
ncbi:MAG: NFACT family protein, partial [Firmicutes bacterium]|nr:NFACT family protein [Bacillota bacterium]